ncbi:MAG: hypothetical protein WD648_05215 [Planctomycetaceae bacterium]
MENNFVKPEFFSLKHHANFNEKWVQERIAEDPKILGLGDLIVRDKERRHPGAGRLDLLLQEPDLESGRRYEVEIQLGRTDESHIIRTIEYWDIERKRYPQFDHCAVIVAEDITSRFLNVVNLFNGFIPMIAVQMKAFRWGGNHSLIFTTVMDERPLGPPEKEEQPPITDRSYWESKSSQEIVAMADRLLEMIKTFDPEVEMKYNKFYIGMAKDGEPDNFVSFGPKSNFLKLTARLDQSGDWDAELDQSGLDLMPYDRRNRRYRIRLKPQDIEKHASLLTKIMKTACIETES